MKPFSDVGRFLGALFSSAVFGLLSESVLGRSRTTKVVISSETSFKILVFDRVAKTPFFGSMLAPFWHPIWHRGCSFCDIFGVTFWGVFFGVQKVMRGIRQKVEAGLGGP